MEKNNIPLYLTLLRLIISPALLPFLIVILLPFNNFFFNCLVAGVFLLLSLTDFVDGFLARRYKQETAMGALLDPIADKSLVCSTLIALVAVGKLFFYWAIIVILREFFVMTVRMVACEHGSTVSVSWYGKIKTMIQMAYITVVLINTRGSLYIYTPLNALEMLLLALTLLSTLGSAWNYYKRFQESLRLPAL